MESTNLFGSRSLSDRFYEVGLTGIPSSITKPPLPIFMLARTAFANKDSEEVSHKLKYSYKTLMPALAPSGKHARREVPGPLLLYKLFAASLSPSGDRRPDLQ